MLGQLALRGPGPRSVPLGVRIGGWNLGSADRTTRQNELAAWETWTGQRADRILEVVVAANSATWTLLTGNNWVANAGQYPADVKSRFLIGYVAMPNATNDSAATLARIAAGNYDSTYNTFFTNLVNNGMGACAFGPMHEMNGTWYRWSVTGAAGFTATDYINAWRKLHTLARARGFTGPFVWSPNLNPTNIATQCYPGDAYVDVVAPDFYDQFGAYKAASNVQTQADRQSTWTQISTNLNVYANIAKDGGKPFGAREWGIFARPDGYGGGDNPWFIHKVFEYFAAQPSRWALCYFNEDASDGDHQLYPPAQFRESGNAFVAQSSSVGTAPATPAVVTPPEQPSEQPPAQAPSGLALTPSETSIAASWSPVSGATSYDVESSQV